ncbi:filament-like plant protein 7-like [Dorcoceras hygrometricum]|uniref:Filament-like plant protein 7-like n=1 Tax=Dorcoceras hygrometricum TaxID=472368 RepID=A0A2Z7CH02_9LAMI|nr:filament-like plant protein 7-like [Dorcoceras hygrometricum]
MEQKTWLWRKRSSEKTILANGEEVQSSHPSEAENSWKSLSERLASVLEECSAKDDILQKHKKIAADALHEKLQAEEELLRLRQELDETKQEKAIADERLSPANSALKDGMNKLSRIQEHNDKRMAVEFEKSQKELEEKLAETSKRLADLTVESLYLSKALAVKEELNEDLKSYKYQLEAELKELLARLDSVEKENVFLRYEFRVLEKEFEIRNEDLEYGRRYAEASQKQNLDNVKKIKKLEAKCQRLRALTGKHLQSPDYLANVKSDVEIEGRNQIDIRRKKGTTTCGLVPKDASKKVFLLLDQVKDLEKENKILKECMSKKDEEILYLLKMKNSTEAGSCDSSALECRMIGASSDMRLMDDFVEMEKLAIVSVNSPFTGSFTASQKSHSLSDSSNERSGYRLISTNMEPVPMEQTKYTEDLSSRKPRDWLQDVVDVILKETEFSKRSTDELLGDISLVLNSVIRPEARQTLPISGYLTWNSSSSTPPGTALEEPSNEFHRSETKNSTVRDEFKKHLGGDGPGTAFDLESVQNLMLDAEKIHSSFQMNITGLENELNILKSKEKDFEANKQQNGALLYELKQSHQTITHLQDEITTLKESKKVKDGQSHDVETQLSVTKAKLNEVVKKLYTAEVELDNKTQCCEELEGMCLELQLQLESNTINQHSIDKENPEELLQTDLEITRASAKLAECEKTILSLGTQLKALGASKEMAVANKVLSITEVSNKKFNLRPSLRDQMLKEDSAKLKHLHSPRTKEIIDMTKSDGPSVFPDKAYLGSKHEARSSNEGALVIFQSRRKGWRLGFLRKLMLRRKKSGCSKTTFYFG